MDYFTIVGTTAALFTTISFFPQVVKIWTTKSTQDISLVTFLVFCIGAVLWLIYGIMLNDIPIITTNSIIIFQALIILVFKIRYK
jgi:MtN3 and saliva related transmembrane protein